MKKGWIILIVVLAVLGLFLVLNFYFESNSKCLNAGESEQHGGVPSDEDISKMKVCCEGLRQIGIFYGIDEKTGSCINAVGGYGYACAPCGNGKCEEEYGENKCNCAEDCDSSKNLYTCKTDTDCIFVDPKNCCGCYAVINKNQLAYWNSLKPENCTDLLCEMCQYYSSDLNAVCKEGTCQVVPK